MSEGRAARLALLAAGALAALQLLFPVVALARGGGGAHSGGGGSAGGGGGFSGGGFGGGGFVGGYGGGFNPFDAICLVILVPILIVGFVLWRRRTLGDGTGVEYQPPVVPPAGPYPVAPAAPPVGEGLAAIIANDPGFNEVKFDERARMAFFMLQRAWMDRNLDEGRAYMSPGLYMTWKQQVDQMVQLHKKNILENLNIQGLRLVAAEHTSDYDHITVRFDAVCADYEVDETTGKLVFGQKQDRPFTEYWTFTRSAGARTLVTGGVTDQKCPNCGAPLSVNETGECHYCKTAITSGQFDWTLSRIDQDHEWGGPR
ncbi:MAG: Tim44 domain-containing protein [Candidatus Dormibacteria bacterium]